MAQFFVLLALNLAGIMLIFLYVRGRVRKALELEGLLARLRGEVGRLVQDLNQTTERNITLLEDAVRTLKDAVAEADRRASVLRREAERRTAEGAVYDRLGRVREAALAPRQADAASGGIPAPAPATTADRPPDSGPAVSSVVPAVPFVTFSSAPVRTRQPLREEVLSLNSRGFSAELIAAKLGVTVAEVDLIVSLEEQKGLAARGEQGG